MLHQVEAQRDQPEVNISFRFSTSLVTRVTSDPVGAWSNQARSSAACGEELGAQVGDHRLARAVQVRDLEVAEEGRQTSATPRRRGPQEPGPAPVGRTRPRRRRCAGRALCTGPSIAPRRIHGPASSSSEQHREHAERAREQPGVRRASRSARRNSEPLVVPLAAVDGSPRARSSASSEPTPDLGGFAALARAWEGLAVAFTAPRAPLGPAGAPTVSRTSPAARRARRGCRAARCGPRRARRSGRRGARSTGGARRGSRCGRGRRSSGWRRARDSVSVSTALSESSSTSTAGRLASARAMHVRWRWPPESVTPRSPISLVVALGEARDLVGHARQARELALRLGSSKAAFRNRSRRSRATSR
jgi:hypothetical protein